jgi:hypothetical protein
MNALTLALLGSMHVGTPELDGIHPVIEYGNAMYYRNSFGKHAIAGYKRFELFRNFTLRVGLTTGYNKIMIKDDYAYEVPFAIADNLSLFVVPSYDMDVTRDTSITMAIMGNALAVGLKLKL